MQTRINVQGGKSQLFHSSQDQQQNHTFFAREGVNPLTHAFDRKITVHAGFGGLPVPKERHREVMAGLLAQPRQQSSAVYIHVPFCESHCLYCGFFNRAFQKEDGSCYTEALLREIDLWRSHPAFGSYPIHAVYIGGGTPTTLDAGDLERLLLAVRSALPLANDCEITVEGRVHNFGPEKMAACLAGGANRFSIGVQTFHTELRQAMGRIADRETVMQTLTRLTGFDRAVVVIDLIYGFPGQTMDMWRSDIQDFFSLGLDGADLYQLNVFRESPLEKVIARGTMPPAADLPWQARMFSEGVDLFDRARYRRLSMSHWGRTTRERNIYNHLMKGPVECLAFGPGSSGCLDGYFYFVDTDYREWLAAVKNGDKPISMVVGPGPMAGLSKTIAAGFDLGRLCLDHLHEAMGQKTGAVLDPLLDQWRRAGLVTVSEGWVEFTIAGQFWHVNLAQLLIDYLKHNVFDADQT